MQQYIYVCDFLASVAGLGKQTSLIDTQTRPEPEGKAAKPTTFVLLVGLEPLSGAMGALSKVATVLQMHTMVSWRHWRSTSGPTQEIYITSLIRRRCVHFSPKRVARDRNGKGVSSHGIMWSWIEYAVIIHLWCKNISIALPQGSL